MKKTTSKKLLNYGTMSVALLGAASVSGQITYTDLEPDEIINAGEGLNIDVNGDGTNDFSAHIIASFNNTDSFGARFITAPDANPDPNTGPGPIGSTGNGFVGTGVNVIGEYVYVSNLVAGTPINESNDFLVDARGEMNFSSCAYSNSQFCDGVVDGYIGVSLNLEGETHFGWIRVDVPADATSMTVKDFAIQSMPNTAIEAGDMGEALSLEDNVIEGLSTYVANNALTINAVNPIENVAIYNLSGQEVISRVFNNTTDTSIDLNSLSTGAYIASIQSEGTITAIKFVK